MDGTKINLCIETLEKFGKLICQGKENYIQSVVTEVRQDNYVTAFALYIIGQEISYEYRAISVDIKSETTLQVNFHTLKTMQTEPYTVDISAGVRIYSAVIQSIITNSLFTQTISFIINQIELKREYKNPSIKNQIIPGQARIAKVKDLGEIPVGFIRIDGDSVIYYTGRGLRTMWKPNMSEDEKKVADDLKNKDESELMKLGHIEKRNIEEFIEII